MIARAIVKHLRQVADVAALLTAGRTDIDVVPVYLGTVPPGIANPTVTVIGLSGSPDYHLGGEIEDCDHRIQIAVFAETELQCDDIMDAIRLALSGQGGTWGGVRVHYASIENERDAYTTPSDASNRAEWTKSTDYMIGFDRTVAA